MGTDLPLSLLNLLPEQEREEIKKILKVMKEKEGEDEV